MNVEAQVGPTLALAAFLLAGISSWLTHQGTQAGRRWQLVERASLWAGLVGLIAGLVLRGLAADVWPLDSWADRALILALVPASFGAAQSLRTTAQAPGLSLVPVIPLSFLAIVGPASDETVTAPALVLACLAAAGLTLWTAGRASVAWLGWGEKDPRTFKWAFGGLTLVLAASCLLNWRVWGTPTGNSAATTSLLSGWLVAAAKLLLENELPRLEYGLTILSGIVLALISLFIQWNLVPLSINF